MTVDELVVTLALDTSNFNQGQKDALESFRKTDEEMEKRMKSLEAANKNVGYSFNDTTSAAQGLFSALLGGGLAAFAHDMMTSTAAAGRAAANIGLMADEYQAFGRTVQRNGGDFDTAVGSLTSLNNQVERLKMTGEASESFWQFIGMVNPTEEELKNPLKLMEAFSRYAESHKDNIKDVNYVGQLGGIDQGSINTLLKGRTEFLKEYSEALKGTATPQQVEAMKNMQDAWVTLEQKMGDVGRNALTDIAPDFISAASAVSKFTENNKELSVSIVEILAKLIELRVAIVALRMLGLGAIAGPVGIAAFGAYEATKRLMPDTEAKKWDDAHPWLKKIDSFFGLAGSSNNTSAATATPAATASILSSSPGINAGNAEASASSIKALNDQIANLKATVGEIESGPAGKTLAAAGALKELNNQIDRMEKSASEGGRAVSGSGLFGLAVGQTLTLSDAGKSAPSAGDDMARYRDAIARIESRGSGGYSAIGPATRSGDRAYGKYQIMGNNIGPWSQAALGRKLTTQEFMASPESQDAIFNHKFGEYINKFGNPQDAASAWLTGRPLAKGANSRDVFGTSGADYVRQFNSNIGDGGGSGKGSGQIINTGPISVNIQTASNDPREHGRIAANEIRKNLSSSIATQANTGLNN